MRLCVKASRVSHHHCWSLFIWGKKKSITSSLGESRHVHFLFSGVEGIRVRRQEVEVAIDEASRDTDLQRLSGFDATHHFH